MLHPKTGYHFQVEWGGQNINFTEVSGLNIEHEVIEYRDGGDRNNSVQKLPGMRKFTNLVLKRGIMENDQEFYNWIQEVSAGQNFRRDVVIKLLNERHEPTISWKVRNAWPCKYSGPNLNASANEIAIESIELAHDGIEIVV
jgi:phage tail-like protein